MAMFTRAGAATAWVSVREAPCRRAAQRPWTDLLHDRFGPLGVAVGGQPARRFRKVTADHQYEQRRDRLQDEYPVPVCDRQHGIDQNARGDEAERPEAFEIGDVAAAPFRRNDFRYHGLRDRKFHAHAEAKQQTRGAEHGDCR